MIAAFNFLIYSNIWIALAAVSLNLYFYKIAQIKPDWIVCAFVFTSTLFIYNFQRIAKLNTGTAFSGERLVWMKKHIWISKILSGVALGTSLLFFLLLDLNTLYVLVPVGIVSIFYVGRFLLKGISGFRDIPFMKAYLVSFSWASVIVLLPSLHAHFELGDTVWIMGICIATLVFSLAIIFDLRDANLDEKSKRTIPQLIGKNGTLALAIIGLFFSMLFPLLLDSSMWILSLTVVAFGSFLMLQVSEKKSDFYFSFFLDGILILPGFMSIFFE